MWSIIDTDKYPLFLQQYPELVEDQNLFKLYESNNKIFLPRFFYKSYPSKYINVYNPNVFIENIDLKFKGELRDNQFPLMNHILNLYNRNGVLNGIIKCPPGFGKAQPLDAKILTPDGWKYMHEIAVGNYVIGKNGFKTKVTGIYPQGKQLVYRITFNDGTFTECTDDHLWNVKKHGYKSYRTLSLKTIRYSINRKNDPTRMNWFIPMVDPVHFTKKNVKIHPYLLGVLLGDGYLSKKSISLSTQDEYIYQRCATLTQIHKTQLKAKKNSKYEYIFKSINSNENQLKRILNSYHLIGKKANNKFIPEDYLFNDIETRIELLRGLMDTDGYVRKSKHRNEVSFTTISRKLADGIVFLIHSLGGKASVYSKIPKYTHNGIQKNGKLAYIIQFSLPKNILPFALPRKCFIYDQLKQNPPTRGIKSIACVGEKECQCISIEADDGLYSSTLS